MKKIILLSVLSIVQPSLYGACVPARVVVDYPDDIINVGMYHRVHPSGNYLIASKATDGAGENKVAIIDLTGRENDKIVAKAIQTPLIDESYPVEGSWTLIASPRHTDGMRYYKFDDVLKEQQAAKPVLNDPNHSQWYHSSAELPGSTPSEMKFRTMLYTESRFRDYSISYNADGSVRSSKMSETVTACGSTLSAPILSKDGTEVASSNGGTTKIYKIDGKGICTLEEDLGFFTSKVNFSYPEPKTKGKIVFMGQANLMVNGAPQSVNGIFLYNRDSHTTSRISSSSDDHPGYPGMTKDGRVIYVNQNSREIVIVDPNQIGIDGKEKSDKSKCIEASVTGGTSPSAPVKKDNVKQQ